MVEGEKRERRRVIQFLPVAGNDTCLQLRQWTHFTIFCIPVNNFKAVRNISTAAHFPFLIHVEKPPLILISKWLICRLTKDMVKFVKI